MNQSGRHSVRVGLFAGVCAGVCLLLLFFYKTLMVPFLIGLFFAYILLPVVDYLNIKLKKIPRVYIVAVVILLVITIIGFAIAGIVPVIKEQVITIAAMIPKAKDHILQIWVPWLYDLLVTRFDLIDEFSFEEAVQEFGFASQFSEPAAAIQKIMNQTSGVLGGVVDVALIPLFCFFMMSEYHRIVKWVRSIVPEDLLPAMVRFRDEVDFTLRNVIKRQAAVALILGVLYMMGFSMVGLTFAATIGAIAGVCRIVPYLDIIVGSSLAAVVTITDPAGFSLTTFLGVLVVIAVVQSIDGMLITPRIIGGKVGLHPGIVIASIFAFGDWFGFAGVLLAIPAVAVIKIIVVAGIQAYREGKFYNQL